MQNLTTRSYCCYYHPRADAPAESGVLPSIRLQAADADAAARLAYATLNLPIDRVERIDPPMDRRAANDGRQVDEDTRALLDRAHELASAARFEGLGAAA